jgi:hypothetical protein
MESLKEYYLLAEDTTASTYFEGVIIDCWNLHKLSEAQFKKKILLQTNVKKFIEVADKQWTAVFPYKRANNQRDKKATDALKQSFWHFAQLCKDKIKSSGKAGPAGQSYPGVSAFWKEETGKGKDTSKADIVIGKDQVSVKGPKALLMSGEQKESRATVLSALKQSGVQGKLKKELLGYVDQFVTSTRTVGAQYTSDALRKADPKELASGDKSLLKQKKIATMKEGNAAARKILDDQEKLKGTIEAGFQRAFNNKAVGLGFAWESMTGWEKFGGKTFDDPGDDVGRANVMLAWDYSMNALQYHKIKSTGPYTSKIAKEMKMSANMKSGSYSKVVDGKKQKLGYSFYQTVRLTVSTAFKKTDELKEAYFDAIEKQQNLLMEGEISEAKMKAVLQKMWDWFTTKVKKIWNWVMVEISKLKTAIVELFDDGVQFVMNAFETDVYVRVNTTVRTL